MFITRQDKPVLRKILVQCAWVTIKDDYSLRKAFGGLEDMIGARRAILAIARRLIERLGTCLGEKCKYQMVTENGELVTHKDIDIKEVVEVCEEAVHSCS
jgi:hypothetical protein